MNTASKNTAWFETWFDTNYYHILYANRDEQEAERFIGNLINFLKPELAHAHFLDLACGKGRHSIYMNKLGYRVTGVDLSANSITQAQSAENETLTFAVQDMREPLLQKFTHIFNLFTSFGYFDSIQENHRVMQAIDAMTESGSYLIFDYLNAEKVVKNLVRVEQIERQNLIFNIQRKTDETHVYKYIEVVDGSEKHQYMERVQLLGLFDFQDLLQTINFELLHTFGNFDLQPYDASSSDRLILIARKK
jgi:SAM-dependent methyltransferase